MSEISAEQALSNPIKLEQNINSRRTSRPPANPDTSSYPKRAFEASPPPLKPPRPPPPAVTKKRPKQTIPEKSIAFFENLHYRPKYSASLHRKPIDDESFHFPIATRSKTRLSTTSSKHDNSNTATSRHSDRSRSSNKINLDEFFISTKSNYKASDDNNLESLENNSDEVRRKKRDRLRKKWSLE